MITTRERFCNFDVKSCQRNEISTYLSTGGFSLKVKEIEKLNDLIENLGKGKKCIWVNDSLSLWQYNKNYLKSISLWVFIFMCK